MMTTISLMGSYAENDADDGKCKPAMHIQALRGLCRCPCPSMRAGGPTPILGFAVEGVEFQDPKP